MAKKAFDPSSLQAFGHAAAGHDGVLSDASGSVVVKPCTQAEIDFYESVTASHPDLAPHLPTYMGTLSLGADQKVVTGDAESGMIQTANGLERLHGRKLETEVHIVLENITHGFKKPNVLDLKLGAQLWDEAAKLEKRARLDEVSAKTTSGSLGFRIAGMRTYKGEPVPEVDETLKEFVDKIDQSGTWVYNKMYGRKFNAEDVMEGFVAYVLPQSRSKAGLERAEEVLTYFSKEVADIQKAFESKESRMYSASILLVYEGDLEEYAKTKETLAAAAKEPTDEDDEEKDLPKLAAVKMIDFAHATWHPGKGPDENALQGIRSAEKILKDLLDQVKVDLAKA
ncbi:SAICAR synthase-like protein [Lindgomyces ingoldianus]|uniref:SAICAR synthase-like protein n=1 Tax=Lindgomyces ingoldianus TaxID=673940 RepID=A0ACB6R4P9_9PLEO|nr:SAICAR synthase-like protein [Lindgomyces ingoldianus]KAF2473813.1 SAICAR synthase-like protein [Lindgomyces ingoldianus]